MFWRLPCWTALLSAGQKGTSCDCTPPRLHLQPCLTLAHPSRTGQRHSISWHCRPSLKTRQQLSVMLLTWEGGHRHDSHVGGRCSLRLRAIVLLGGPPGPGSILFRPLAPSPQALPSLQTLMGWGVHGLPMGTTSACVTCSLSTY